MKNLRANIPLFAPEQTIEESTDLSLELDCVCRQAKDPLGCGRLLPLTR